jgi:hypothetical protein
VPAAEIAAPARGRLRAFLVVSALVSVLGAGAMLPGCGGSPAQPTPSPQPQPQPPVVVPPPPPPPTAPNTAPVVTGLTAQGTRRREPPNLADAGEEIVVTATVTDAETAVDRLTFDWSSPVGTFSGEGPTVRWRAPATVPAPTVATLQVRVVDGEHRVERTVAVRVHDHVREVGDMATLFLKDFSDSRIPARDVMRDFLPGCYGTKDELEEVEDNRLEFRITSSSIGPARVTVDFDGVCPYQNRDGDACSVSQARWESIDLEDGSHDVAAGADQVAAVYRQDRWWLCESKFDPSAGIRSRFVRLLTRPSSR